MKAFNDYYNNVITMELMRDPQADGHRGEDSARSQVSDGSSFAGIVARTSEGPLL